MMVGACITCEIRPGLYVWLPPELSNKSWVQRPGNEANVIPIHNTLRTIMNTLNTLFFLYTNKVLSHYPAQKCEDVFRREIQSIMTMIWSNQY